MDRSRQRDLENQLAQVTTRFVLNESKFRAPVHAILREIGSSGQPAFFFGGLLRDLMMYGSGAVPRDLDIVIGGGTKSICDSFDCYLKRRTRFGGLHLDAKGWLFDIWNLQDTWAFREGLVEGRNFSDLPKTTFLNVEAVVAEVAPKPGKRRRVFSNGFFEAMHSRTIDINFEENPFPGLCVVRSLLAAYKLNFALAPRLTAYIMHYAGKISVDELLDIQRSHYGRIRHDSSTLHSWLRHLASHRSTSRLSGIKLPRVAGEQLFLQLQSPINDHSAIKHQRQNMIDSYQAELF